jgi:uncharacterized protein YbbC (DUF1343 family)
MVRIGLTRLIEESDLQKKVKGNIGYLCHPASVDHNYQLGVLPLKEIFGDRLKKLFGPQHGFQAADQDNMIETEDFVHPYFNTVVHSLYSETRIPTEEMLEGIDTMIMDLQDVGTRIYTYISTLVLLMEACSKNGIKLVVLDRPNPIGGEEIEGNILDMHYESFIGKLPIPMRHGMTMAEVALFTKKFKNLDIDMEIIEMTGWKRSMTFEQTKCPWVLPSPNLSTVAACYPYVGSVLFEGTNISEGRGTTRSLETIGCPGLEPFSFYEEIKPKMERDGIEGCALRPLTFIPTFHKFQEKPCGGFQIHTTDRKAFKPWRLGQFLCREFRLKLRDGFKWNNPPYEYEYTLMPIDILNGSDYPRIWADKNGEMEDLIEFETKDQKDYLDFRESCLLY